MTFKNYLIEMGKSQSTADTYHRHILSYLAWLDVQNLEAEQVRQQDIMAYQKYLQNKGYSNATRAQYLQVIRQFYYYQSHIGRQENNPAAHIKIRGTKKNQLYLRLNKQEMEQIYQNYELAAQKPTGVTTQWHNTSKLSRKRNKTILGLLVWQGLTTTEINALKVTDVKLREGKIHIQGTRKRAERILELKPHQIMELIEYQKQTRPQLLALMSSNTVSDSVSDSHSALFYLTPPPIGKKTVLKTVNTNINLWKQLTAEIKKKQPKFINYAQLRAGVIEEWLGQYNLRQVQYMAGHKYVTTTERYQRNQIEDLQTDIDQYHPIG